MVLITYPQDDIPNYHVSVLLAYANHPASAIVREPTALASRSTTAMKRHRLPFRFNPRLARRFARLHRLVRAGLVPPGDKASLRADAAEACRTHIIRKVKAELRNGAPR